MHCIAAKGRFCKQMARMVKDTWLSLTTGTLMAPLSSRASSTLLLFQGVLQEAMKLLGKGDGVVGGEVGRRQQGGSLLC